MAKFKRTWRVIVFALSTFMLMASFLTLGMFALAPSGVDPDVSLEVLEDACTKVEANDGPDYKTMVVGASQDTKLSPEDVWKVLLDLEHWGDWCPMTRGQPRWNEGFRWVPGARFHHQVELGFPLGAAATEAFVERVTPFHLLSWSEQRRGAKVCRIWQLDPLPNGGCRVTCVEAARSLSTAVARPFTAGPLQRTFKEAVARIIEHSQTMRDRRAASETHPASN